MNQRLLDSKPELLGHLGFVANEIDAKFRIRTLAERFLCFGQTEVLGHTETFVFTRVLMSEKQNQEQPIIVKMMS